MHSVVAGLGYGDEGKGSVVDYLCSQSPVVAVVRFNGGAQAGHRVVMADGRDHVFSQWGSGTLRGVPTFHSRYVALDPMAMTKEHDHLRHLVPDPYSLMTVDSNCLIVTPFHKAQNRALELARGVNRHGSCGMGHGAAVEHSIYYPDETIRVHDIPYGTLGEKLRLQAKRFPSPGEHFTFDTLECFYRLWLEQVKVAEPDHLTRLAQEGDLVFEGAQGVLLDEWLGFHPYTTWSTTTFLNAKTLLLHANVRFKDVTKIGVLRAISTRHGAGPFLSEEPGWLKGLKDEHNTLDEWQGNFRLGNFDAIASQYACEMAKPDVLALTHLDNAEHRMSYVSYYWPEGEPMLTRIEPPSNVEDLEERTRQTQRLLQSTPVYVVPRTSSWADTIENLLGVPVTLESWGPTAEDKRVPARSSGREQCPKFV